LFIYVILTIRFLCEYGGLKCRNWVGDKKGEEGKDQIVSWKEIRKSDGKEVTMSVKLELAVPWKKRKEKRREEKLEKYNMMWNIMRWNEVKWKEKKRREATREGCGWQPSTQLWERKGLQQMRYTSQHSSASHRDRRERGRAEEKKGEATTGLISNGED
jgi:hypothetical protein